LRLKEVVMMLFLECRWLLCLSPETDFLVTLCISVFNLRFCHLSVTIRLRPYCAIGLVEFNKLGTIV
jgi:hypothetical protein